MKQLFAFAALAAAIISPTANAATNLVTNGSFEITTLTDKGDFQSAQTDLTNVAGWSGGAGLTYLDFPGTSTNFTVDANHDNLYGVYPGLPASSPDGGNFVQADGDPTYAHAIYQTINGLTVGANYTLTFDQAAGQQYGFYGPTTERWDVTLGSESQLSDQYSLMTPDVGQWEAQKMTFTATSASEVLSFMAVGTPAGMPPTSFLDGVSLVAAVPEPATWGMMLVGLGAMGAAARMRRRQASFAA